MFINPSKKKLDYLRISSSKFLGFFIYHWQDDRAVVLLVYK